MFKQSIFLPIVLSVLFVSCRVGAPPELTQPAELPSPSPLVIITPAISNTLQVISNTPTSDIPPISTSSLFKISWDDRSVFRDGLVKSEQDVFDRMPGASIYHINLTISDDLKHVQGQEEVRYTNQEDVPLNEVVFHLYPNMLDGEMTVASVTVNSSTVSPTYELKNSLMRVPLASLLPPGGQVIVFFDFAVTVPGYTDNNYGIFAFEDGVLSLADVYPMIAVYDSRGWNTDVPGNNGDITYSDASFYIVRVDAPAKLVIVASGRETDKEKTVYNQQVTFAAGPARDFYVVASPSYTLLTGKAGDVTVNSYAPAQWSTHAQLALDTAVTAIQDYSERYSPYPYTKFDIVAITTDSGGVEFPGMTALDIEMYDPQEEFDGEPSGDYLKAITAHEVGHQWFYNLVGNDQLDEPWLDEALTEYITWQYYKDLYGAKGNQYYKQAMQESWDEVGGAKTPIGLPASTYSEDEYDAIVYGRGALFLDVLANQMGQEKFDQFLRDYVQENAWSNVTAEGFKQLAEKTCNCNLTPLFQEWVYP